VEFPLRGKAVGSTYRETWRDGKASTPSEQTDYLALTERSAPPAQSHDETRGGGRFAVICHAFTGATAELLGAGGDWIQMDPDLSGKGRRSGEEDGVNGCTEIEGHCRLRPTFRRQADKGSTLTCRLRFS